MKLIYILAAVTVLANCTAAPSAPPIDTKAILGIMTSPDPSGLIARLETARTASKGKEAELFERTIAVVRALDGHTEQFPKQFDAYVQITRDLAALYPNDLGVQRDVAWAFVGFAMTAPGIERDPVPFRDEALRRARAVTAEFPKDGAAHGVLGAALSESKADPLASAKEYKSCADLDPQNVSCKETLERFRAYYRAPQCTGAGIQPGLGFEPSGGIVSADFAQVAVMDDETMRVTMTPEGAKKLAAHTARIAEEHGNLKIVFAGETLLDARVGGPIPDGIVSVHSRDPKASELAKRVCVKLESPPVPVELQ